MEVSVEDREVCFLTERFYEREELQPLFQLEDGAEVFITAAAPHAHHIAHHNVCHIHIVSPANAHK